MTTAETMEEAKLVIQEGVNKIAKWCKDWGQIINQYKSAMTYFTNKRETIGDLVKLDTADIPYQKTVKILGVVLDSAHLTWKQQIEEIEIKCQERINIMKCMTGTKDLLRNYFVTHIKSLIYYGLPIYSSSAPTNLSKINIVYISAVGPITGAWKSTPIHALYCEAGILPPDLQLTMNCASYLAKLRAVPADHPINKIYFRDILIILILGGKIYKTPFFCRVKNSNISQQLNDLIEDFRPAEKQVFPQ